MRQKKKSTHCATAPPCRPQDEIADALERIIAGPEKKGAVISDRKKQLVAYHEAGHALVGGQAGGRAGALARGVGGRAVWGPAKSCAWRVRWPGGPVGSLGAGRMPARAQKPGLLLAALASRCPASLQHARFIGKLSVGPPPARRLRAARCRWAR